MGAAAWPPEVIQWKVVSSYLVVGGAIILWVSLIFFGIVAKRYEMVLRKKTQWQYIMMAPSGILIYAIIMLYSSIVRGYLKMKPMEEMIAYGLFFLSGILSLIGALRFRAVVSPKRR
ncbi:hypothetical protein DRQ16_03975 [bacterium]|nr:MAG: hypothetical protein DRQ16_03975 [bacterium]RKZ21237.1 MAG: hypothetical protein DRQ18_04835 [bacterium]